MNTDNTSSLQQKIELGKLLEEIFLVLSPKEKEVITKRFSLDNKAHWTLEKIGQKFEVTRERIRQIEKIALGKLRRTAQNTKINTVNEIANEILRKNGGVMLEERLIQSVLKAIFAQEEVDAHIVRLSLNINPYIEFWEKNNAFNAFWRWKEIPLKDIEIITQKAVSILKEKSEVIDGESMVTLIQEALPDSKKYSPEMIFTSMETDCRIKKTKENTFGLMTWRHINPKSIRDKALIVLKKNSTPMHFMEIAEKIAALGFDRKVVTIQAVHNELIRCDQFVLVGRGLYALKEWGYKKGTVADIIQSLLEKKSPLNKQEIIAGVLKQRQVKKGTISLNLQKNEMFVRVGRAVYALAKKA
jgi:hypothetical protein